MDDLLQQRNDMTLFVSFSLLVIVGLLPLSAAELIKNEQGVVGYSDTEVLPWADYRKHDSERPLPPHVESKPVFLPPPADAVVLFDGSDLEAWQPNEWHLRDGIIVTGEGDLVSKALFGDCQIHLEFKTPVETSPVLGNRGNSGVRPMLFYEIQVFDSHPSHPVQLYPDGQCAAIYGETPPLFNACRAPGEWQSYDIFFRAPRFHGDTLVEPARVTVVHNGIFVHIDQVIHGRVAYRDIVGYRPHADALPLKLEGHKGRVSYRNIWVRPLNSSPLSDQ